MFAGACCAFLNDSPVLWDDLKLLNYVPIKHSTPGGANKKSLHIVM